MEPAHNSFLGGCPEAMATQKMDCSMWLCCDSLWIESGKLSEILATASSTTSHFVVHQG